MTEEEIEFRTEYQQRPYIEKRNCITCRHMRLYHRTDACRTASWDDDRNCSNYKRKRGKHEDR